MRVLLVTSDREQCGIREYGRLLQAELEKLGVEVIEHANTDPYTVDTRPKPDVLHLNHHQALHSRWKPEHVRELREKCNVKVVVTQHDTFETSAIMQERGFESWIAADAWVTHEEVEGLPYWHPDAPKRNCYFLHQGVPAAAEPAPYGSREDGKPVLGMFGFDFPWKNFDMGARLCAQAGWRLLVVSAGMTKERWQELKGYGAPVDAYTGYASTPEVVGMLASCTATAFLYQNGNSATSAAIRTGIAARRPVVAIKCRQFRDLYNRPGVWWTEDEEDILDFLEMIQDPSIAKVQSLLIERAAEEMSWARIALQYRAIYERITQKEA